MSHFTCGNCLFAEEVNSSDMIYCPIKETHLKVNEPGCSRHAKRPAGMKHESCSKCNDTGWVLAKTLDGKQTAQRCECQKRRIEDQKKGEEDGHKNHS